MTVAKDPQLGTLYVVATPIGNLEDITYRAVRILSEVNFVAAEDTRHTRKLLNHLGISKPLQSYYKDRETARTEKIIEKLRQGEDVALVSDAGTPAISDPGALLVAACQKHHIPVIPIPGPSAVTTLLSAAGFRQHSFTFLGFLPSKRTQLRSVLTAHAQDEEVLVFYDSPRRICKTLALCQQVLGEREAVIGRELTKVHEELLSGTLPDLLEIIEKRDVVKGEFVVAVAPHESVLDEKPEDLLELLHWYKKESGLSMKDAVKKISKDLNLSRSYIYKMALSVWKEK